MDTKDERKTLGHGWEHLFPKNTRSTEEKRTAEAKESARRRGRGAKSWHLKYLDEDGRRKG